MSIFFAKDSKEQIIRGLEKRANELRDFISRNKRKSMAIAGAALLGIGNMGLLTGCDEKSEKYVITYDYTNVYDHIPDNNKEKKLNINDIIEFDKSNIQYRNPEKIDGKEVWNVVNEGENMYQSKWLEYQDGDDKNLYVPSQDVDIFSPYRSLSSNSVPAKIRKSPAVQDDNIIDTITGKDICYINPSRKYRLDGSNVVELGENENSGDNLSWCQVLIKKIDENNKLYYDIGYIALEVVEPVENNNVVGIVNTPTFARAYPKVTELEGKIITDTAKNGDVFEVTELHENGDETWLEFEDSDGKKRYIASYSSKPLDTFETEAKINGNYVEISSSVNNSKTAFDGDSIMVDTSKAYSGLYEVYSKKYNCTGFVAPEAVMLEVGMTLKEKNDESESTKTTAEAETTTKKKSKKNDKKSKSTTTESKSDKKTETTTQPQKSTVKIDDDITFVVDLSIYGNLDAYKQMIHKLKQDGKISAVIFEIGTTDEKEPLGRATFNDSAEDRAAYQNGVANNSLQKSYDQIASKSGQKFMYTNAWKDFGDFTVFKQFVEAALDEGLAIGFYDYLGGITPNEASAEAADTYAKLSKLEDELGDKYRKARKLPLMIDIENAGDYRNSKGNEVSADGVHTNREAALIEYMKLLGKGTNNDACWTLDGINPKEGYRLFDSYSIYGDINKIDAYASVERLNQALDKDYKVYEWMTRSITSAGGFCEYGVIPNFSLDNYNGTGILNPKSVIKAMNENKYINTHGARTRQLAEMSEALQYGLEGIHINGQGIDLSITTKRNLMAMCGEIEYTEKDEFLEDINKVVNGDNKKEELER